MTTRNVTVKPPLRRTGSDGSLTPAVRRLRYACQRCGAHLDAVAYKHSVSGMCGNCGSYEIAPLAG